VGDFFRDIVEPLSDSFDPEQAAVYEELMREWIPESPRVKPVIPPRVSTVYVLSRVTLGSDIKITSIMLDAMQRRFPEAEIVFVGTRKSAELFQGTKHLEANYPRSGPVSHRLAFAHDLTRRLEAPDRIVVDPDSRMTQLGLLPVCEPGHYFHFPSRTASTAANLTDLTKHWLVETFGVSGEAFIAPEPVIIDGSVPFAAISLGVGENENKRIPGDFETELIRELGRKYDTLWIDRGAGGEEALRVTAAVNASGVAGRVRFWEGSFAGFAWIISQSSLYCGYDSAGQHAAAACGTPLITFFAGAPSERFAQRWAPQGRGSIRVIMETAWTSEGLRSILAASSS
jgi:ADP-heptose:LPS heptosyltransferase